MRDIYIPPVQPQRLNWGGDGQLLNLYVSAQSLRELAQQSGTELPGLKLADRPDRAVYEIGRLLLDEFQSMGGLAPALIDHAIFLISRRVLRARERMAKGEASGVLSPKRLQPAIDMTGEKPGVRLHSVAIAVGIENLTHFSRLFRDYVGCSPREYRQY